MFSNIHQNRPSPQGLPTRQELRNPLEVGPFQEQYIIGCIDDQLRELAARDRREIEGIENFLRDNGRLRDYVDSEAGVSIRGEVVGVAWGPQNLTLETGEQRRIETGEVAVKVLEWDETPSERTCGLILVILRQAQDGSFVTVRSDQYWSGRLPFGQEAVRLPNLES